MLFALLTALLPTAVLGGGWTTMKRVTDERTSRLDSLHQLAADRGELHLVHPRTGSGQTDDRVFYQRSADDGATWSDAEPLFVATRDVRHVVPNLALAARGGVVAVAWRAHGPRRHTLFIRVSRDGGDTFAEPEVIFSTRDDDGIGVPAVAVGAAGKLVTVAWTDRAKGRLRVRSSRDVGRTFGDARTIGQTGLSIDCRERLTDGLVGLAASKRLVHVAWSLAPKGRCQASSIALRTSDDRGRTWGSPRTITQRRSYGWPELDARGRTVMASVQSTGGGVVLARSADDGASWDDRLLKAPRGFSFSAADIVLMDGRKAMITYVKERVRRSRLLATEVVSRWSPDDGASLRRARSVAPEAERLRMAPNVASIGRKVAIVLQSGPMSGATRSLYVTRLR